MDHQFDQKKRYKRYYLAGLLLLTAVFQLHQVLFTVQRQFAFSFKKHENITTHTSLKDQNGKNIDIYMYDNKSDIDFVFIHGSILSGKVFKNTLETMSTKTGFNIISYYMRGMNNRRGQPSEKSLIEEACLVGDFIKQRGRKVVVYGQSLGCSVALSLATYIEASKTILENPFTEYKKIVKTKAFFGWFWYLVVDNWNNVERIKKYNGKVLMLVSENDKLVDRENSNELAGAHKDTKIEILKDNTHFNVQKNPNYHQYIVKFVNQG